MLVLNKKLGISNAIVDNSDERCDEGTVQKVGINQLQYDTVMEHLGRFVPSPDEEDAESASYLEFSQSEALLVLRRAVCTFFFVTGYLKSPSKCSYFQGTDIFFTTFIVTLEGLPNNYITYTQATRNLNDILASWKFKRVEVEGDGNCLFSAISLAIINRLRDSDLLLQQRLASLGLSVERIEHISVGSIACSLRQLMVSEWLENTDIYQDFTTIDIRQAAHTYMSDGEFTGDLGDLMVLTSSNLLNTQTTLFTSIANMPLLCVTPTMQAADTTIPTFFHTIKLGQDIMIMPYQLLQIMIPLNYHNARKLRNVPVAEKMVFQGKH